MNHVQRGLIAALLMTASSAVLALPVSYTEITIWDGEAPGSVGNPAEDQETEPGTVNDQTWDLESWISYGGSQVGIISGYNFLNPPLAGGDGRPGDIFIDTNGSYQPGNATGSDGNTVVQNTFGYEYALDIDWTNLTYNILQLGANTFTEDTAYGINEGSSPWRYISGGTLLGSGSFTLEGYPTPLTDAQTGKTGGNHYAALGFDLSFLGLNTNYTVHFTTACGNDNLMGSGTVVPVPAAVWLFGSAFGTLVLLRRRAAA